MKAIQRVKRAMIGLIVGFGILIAACNSGTKSAEEGAGEANQPESTVIASGSFEGRSDHEVSGAVEIVESGGKFVVNLGGDFSLDGAPDPKVGLGKDGYNKETKAGALKSKTGASSYELPDGIDPRDYNEVYIWCEKFDVPLGVAKLTSK